jgi:hypothetical protein
MKSLAEENTMKDFFPSMEDDPLIEDKRCAVGVNFLNVVTKNSVPDMSTLRPG